MVALELGMAAGVSKLFRDRADIVVALGMALLPSWTFRRKTSIEERVEGRCPALDGKAGAAEFAILAPVFCAHLRGLRHDGDCDPSGRPRGRCGLQQTTSGGDLLSRRHHQQLWPRRIRLYRRPFDQTSGLYAKHLNDSGGGVCLDDPPGYAPHPCALR